MGKIRRFRGTGSSASVAPKAESTDPLSRGQRRRAVKKAALIKKVSLIKKTSKAAETQVELTKHLAGEPNFGSESGTRNAGAARSSRKLLPEARMGTAKAHGQVLGRQKEHQHLVRNKSKRAVVANEMGHLTAVISTAEFQAAPFKAIQERLMLSASEGYCKDTQEGGNFAELTRRNATEKNRKKSNSEHQKPRGAGTASYKSRRAKMKMRR